MNSPNARDVESDSVGTGSCYKVIFVFFDESFVNNPEATELQALGDSGPLSRITSSHEPSRVNSPNVDIDSVGSGSCCYKVIFVFFDESFVNNPKATELQALGD